MRGSLLSVNNSRTKKEPEMTVRYYISSADLTAEKFATAIRNHWHVENKLHWRLDVVMNEDDCKIRRGNAAELFSGIRHIAINILTNDKVFKAGLRRKMRKAAMDRNYLASVLAGAGFRNLSTEGMGCTVPADKSQLAGKLAECCHILRVPGGDPQGYLHH